MTFSYIKVIQKVDFFMRPNLRGFLQVQHVLEKAVWFGGESTRHEVQLPSLALLLQWRGVGKSSNLAVSGFPHLQNGNDNICAAPHRPL